jgi:hypothetical protein
MRELLTREVLGLAFVEVYFGYGMHNEVVVAYFLGQVVADDLLDNGVETKAKRHPNLVPVCCHCYYYNLFILQPVVHLAEASMLFALMICCWHCHDLQMNTLNGSTSNLSSSSSSLNLVVN